MDLVGVSRKLNLGARVGRKVTVTGVAISDALAERVERGETGKPTKMDREALKAPDSAAHHLRVRTIKPVEGTCSS